MQIPTDKRSLAVFLRDYGDRRHKTRSEKIKIMKNVIETRKIRVDKNTTIVLNDDELAAIIDLYNKYILGKMKAEINTDSIVKMLASGNGLTIRTMANKLNCSNEVVRKRLVDLCKNDVVIKGINPENKRQGLFYLKSRCVAVADSPAV